ncbi:phosphoribosyltransferase family protein [Lewinella sp. 4G2]|uniref:phosphoribosyltransferase family protein n=1 Tax=Lewinella sp. 4G2 TaxID=1803372 RepID=UPI0007B4CF90|nr:phosphoribosyltransferase family protein [Lewinella sp. 4G2]OAV45030.1 phosphoribosyltransferase [Lewinella sp. 4G2]
MELLNHQQINAKIDRLAMEILERNTAEQELYIIGINNRGLELAERLVSSLRTISEAPIHLWPLTISPATPLDPGPSLTNDVTQLTDKAVLIVDDVANTGRTLFYAMLPLQQVLPKKIEVCVLVDRRHKNWPVYVTYSGMDLSTTIEENVLVTFSGPNGDEATLE